MRILLMSSASISCVLAVFYLIQLCKYTKYKSVGTQTGDIEDLPPPPGEKLADHGWDRRFKISLKPIRSRRFIFLCFDKLIRKYKSETIFNLQCLEVWIKQNYAHIKLKPWRKQVFWTFHTINGKNGWIEADYIYQFRLIC